MQDREHKKMEKKRTSLSDDPLPNEHEHEHEPHDYFSIGQEGMANPFDKIIQGVKKLGNDASKAMDPLKEIVDFVNTIKRAFESIPKRVDNFNKAFKTVGHGIEKEFESIGESLHIGVTDVFSLIGAAGECSKKFIVNLNTCILWYLVNLISDIMYGIFIELPIFTLKFFFEVDVSEYWNDFRTIIQDIDTMFINETSFSFLHFPESIIQKCYSCDISREINKLQVDFETTIPNIMNEPNEIFKKAKSEFDVVFRK